VIELTDDKMVAHQAEKDSSLDGKICLVTGGSRGIGRGICLQLAGAGATVYVTGRNQQDLDKIGEEMMARGAKAVHPLRVDHSDDDQVKGLFETIKSAGRLDLLVNNAYSGVDYMFKHIDKGFWEEEDPAANWDRYNNVGLRNHFICSTYAARMMVEQKSGLIINISSAGGLRYIFNVPYGVGKAAVDRMAQDTAHELRKHNVAVVSLWPGAVKTEIVNNLFISKDQPGVSKEEKAAINTLSATIPKDSWQMGETVEFSGKAVVHLAKDGNIIKKTGRVLTTADMALEYGFREDDGTMPLDFFALKTFFLQHKATQMLAAVTPSFIRVPKTLVHLAGFKF